MKKLVLSLIILAPALGILGCSTVRTVPAEAEEKEEDKFAEAVKAADAIEGLFTVYRDTTDGALQMVITPDQLDQEYIYFTHVVDGALAGGHFRGQFRDNAVFSIRRRYNTVEFVKENTSYYFDENSPLSRAAEANISPAVLAVEEIVAEDKATGNLLIKADDLFGAETLAQIKPTSAPGQPPTAFSLGSLSKDKTAVLDVRNYPENTDVLVRYVYDNPAPLNGGGAAVTDARAVSVTLQHTLLAMPENDYEPLIDDPRVGYFTQQVTDLTSTSATPYRDLVRRWNLKKSDPSAALSEPVEPIVWWIENTTPLEYRETIRDAALRWNQAFEAAGFKNAIQVQIQPDDADWDAGDLRYNVLRWTSSPTPPFGGMGPAFVNPRTGQVLGSDIMLEYVFIKNRIVWDELFDPAALIEASPYHCAQSRQLQMETLLGQAALRAAGASESEVSTLVEQSIYYLVLHEIGHTFGLNHNMRASQMLTPEQTTDWDLTMEKGLMGSVMDYPAINVAAPGEPQGAYYITKPGPYDVWAIQLGYADLTDAERRALLARSTEPELAFGNDADDMRSPGKAIDPRVMIGDLSSDAITYAEGRLDLVKQTMDGLLDKYAKQGQSYQELLDAYNILTGQIGIGANVASRYIGGVYVDRAFAGQPGATQPYTPVPVETQRRAMDLLTRSLFAADAFDGPETLYAYLAPQRRGFELFGETEDPKLHEKALTIQQNVLAHLLHPVTLERITDSRLYGNEYSLAEVMEDLTDAIFEADARGDVNTFRQNVQLDYVNRLVMIVENEKDQFDYVAQSQALAQLRRVEQMLGNKRRGNAETRAHTDHLLFVIERGLDLE